jgi:hypothetical protein
VSFGVAVITPRWLYVLAAATGMEWGDPRPVAWVVFGGIHATLFPDEFQQ